MKERESVFLIVRKQFGYSNVYYHWCKYLSKDFNITYFCPDMGWDKINPEFSIHINYFPFNNRNKLVRNIHYIFVCYKFLRKQKGGLCIIGNDFYATWIALLAPKLKCLLDIRVGFRRGSGLRNYFYRLKIKINCRIFQNVTILSENLAKKLNIKREGVNIIPLGSESFGSPNKSFTRLNLLYIGTFNDRNLIETVYGFNKFYLEYKGKIPMHYTIAGFGGKNELNVISQAIDKLGLKNIVKMPGIIKVTEKDKLFEEHNVGISYVPKIKKYNNQPVTKTFEYVLSGMPVIGTSTYENSLVITDENGILIDDNPDAFYEGLKNIYNNLDRFDSTKIRISLLDYEWSNIVSNKLKPVIDNILR